MIKPFSKTPMDTIKNIYSNYKSLIHGNSDNLPLKLTEPRAEIGLDIMSEYCFNHGTKNLGAGIQQSIWRAMDAR